MGGQRRLDLARLDTEASHFDLPILPADEVYDPVGAVPAQVAGTKYAVVRVASEWIHAEAFACQTRVEIPNGKIRGPRTDFTDFADPGKALSLGQDEELYVVNSPSDGQPVSSGIESSSTE